MYNASIWPRLCDSILQKSPRFGLPTGPASPRETTGLSRSPRRTRRASRRCTGSYPGGDGVSRSRTERAHTRFPRQIVVCRGGKHNSGGRGRRAVGRRGRRSGGTTAPRQRSAPARVLAPRPRESYIPGAGAKVCSMASADRRSILGAATSAVHASAGRRSIPGVWCLRAPGTLPRGGARPSGGAAPASSNHFLYTRELNPLTAASANPGHGHDLRVLEPGARERTGRELRRKERMGCSAVASATTDPSVAGCSRPRRHEPHAGCSAPRSASPPGCHGAACQDWIRRSQVTGYWIRRTGPVLGRRRGNRAAGGGGFWRRRCHGQQRRDKILEGNVVFSLVSTVNRYYRIRFLNCIA
jgi:hypothetical protein